MTNQILATTLHRLMRTKNLDSKLKGELRKLSRMFAGVTLIDLKPSVFTRVRLHRNNNFYGFLINVCQLIYENSLPAETVGEWDFADFTRDERKMNQLFEAFIRNFYKIEQNTYRVRSEIIRWNFETSDFQNSQYLPQMKTDITLENRDSKIIIDAKYYKEIMAINYGQEKVKSANLYQLFSYLLNQQTEEERTLTATGILLYPTIENEYNLKFKYQSHDIYIETINLNMNWKNIRQRLEDLIINKISMTKN